ncbi:MAG: hypothetical protein QJR09_01215 [Micrococcus sp.]|nr:hypothetical protein [Micrococcus sp.]
MKSPEASRPSAARRAPRRGRRSITTAPPGPLGEDILLARHGDHIDHFRQDPDGSRTVAVLHDGGTDTAPNHFDGGAVHLSPVDRTRLRLAELSSGTHAQTRREIGFLTKLSLAWLLVSVAVFGLMMWGITTAMEPGDLQIVMSGPLGDPSGGVPAPDPSGTVDGG